MGTLQIVLSVGKALSTLLSKPDDTSREILAIVQKLEITSTSFILNFEIKYPLYSEQKELIINICEVSEKLLFNILKYTEVAKDVFNGNPLLVLCPGQKRYRNQLREYMYSYLEAWFQYYFPTLARMFLPNFYEPINYSESLPGCREYFLPRIKNETDISLAFEIRIELALIKIDILLSYWYISLNQLVRGSSQIESFTDKLNQNIKILDSRINMTKQFPPSPSYNPLVPGSDYTVNSKPYEDLKEEVQDTINFINSKDLKQ